MRWKLVTGLALAAIGLAAAGPTPPLRALPPQNRAAVITRPDWAAQPNGDDVSDYYPQVAAMQGLSGRAEIICDVGTDGALKGCVVTAENPRGAGFGEAAVKMSVLFRMKPKTLDGTPVEGGRVRVPIVFQPPAPDEVGPPMDPAPAAGRFAYAGRNPLDADNGSGAVQADFYVDLSRGRPVAGRTTVWMLVVLDRPRAYGPELVSYMMAWQAVDCAGRQVAEPPTQYFSDTGERIGWDRPVEEMQPVPADYPAVGRIVDLACGSAKADGATFSTVAAARADSRKRFAAAPN